MMMDILYDKIAVSNKTLDLMMRLYVLWYHHMILQMGVVEIKGELTEDMIDNLLSRDIIALSDINDMRVSSIIVYNIRKIADYKYRFVYSGTEPIIGNVILIDGDEILIDKRL